MAKSSHANRYVCKYQLNSGKTNLPIEYLTILKREAVIYRCLSNALLPAKLVAKLIGGLVSSVVRCTDMKLTLLILSITLFSSAVINAGEIQFFSSIKIRKTENGKDEKMILIFHKKGIKFIARLDGEDLGVTQYGQVFTLPFKSKLELVEKHTNHQLSWVKHKGDDVVKIISNARHFGEESPEKTTYYIVRSPDKSLHQN